MYEARVVVHASHCDAHVCKRACQENMEDAACNSNTSMFTRDVNPRVQYYMCEPRVVMHASHCATRVCKRASQDGVAQGSAKQGWPASAKGLISSNTIKRKYQIVRITFVLH